MTERASGWYDDPNDDTLLRYWDGILWSDRTMPKLMPGLDHVGEARPAPTQPGAPESGTGERAGAGASRVGAPGTMSGPRDASAGWTRQQPDPRMQRRGPAMYQGPQYVGHDPRRQAFGNTVGTVSGVARRIVAAFLDKVFVGVPIALAMLPFLHSWVSTFQDYYDRASTAASNGEQMPAIPDDLTAPPITLTLTMILVGLLYETVLTTRFGATFGKKALGIRVAPVDAEPLDDARLPWGRSAARAVVKAVPDLLGLVGVLAALGGFLQIAIILWALTNPLRQGLDDLAARSVVRRTR